jgi:hypothetical protein
VTRLYNVSLSTIRPNECSILRQRPRFPHRGNRVAFATSALTFIIDNTAPRASVNDAATFTVVLKAPADASGTLFLMSGRQVTVPPDGLISVTPEDATPLKAAGWSVQNDLERC